MLECAEEVQLPDAIAAHWCNRPYYGTVNHNVKAVYQRYLGWFSGNPADLHPLPPEPAAAKYVEYMGGAAAVLERATGRLRGRGVPLGGRGAQPRGVRRSRRAPTPSPPRRKALLADTYEQLGYQAESAPWRNFYLVGAHELRHGGPAGCGRHRDGIDGPGACRWRCRCCSTRWPCGCDPEACVGQRLVLNLVVTDAGPDRSGRRATTSCGWRTRCCTTATGRTSTGPRHRDPHQGGVVDGHRWHGRVRRGAASRANRTPSSDWLVGSTDRTPTSRSSLPEGCDGSADRAESGPWMISRS